MKKAEKEVTAEQSVKVIEKEAMPVADKAAHLVIADGKTMAQAVESLSKLNVYADEVKESRESVTKPMNAALKAVRALYAPLETRLEGAILHIRKEMTRYQTEQKKIADAEADKIAARVGEGKGKFTPETGSRKIAEIDKPDIKVHAETGSVQFIAMKKFEVMDVVMLASAECGSSYVLPNEPAIRNAMKLGVELPGVRYYEEQVPRNTR